MIRFIPKLFSEKFVVLVNLFLFILCLLVGVLGYRGKLHGGGDDMNNLAVTVGNGSSLEYVKWYYLNWGQTGIVALIVPIQAFIKLLHVTPEEFPWWFFASINAFCYLAAVYMLVMGGKRLLKYEWHEALFLLAFIYGVWLTPIVYNSTIAIPVTFFVAFTLPVYILTVAIYLFSTNSFGQNRKDWLVIGVIYMLLSINTETFLLSIPVVFTGIIIIHAFQEKYSSIKFFGNLGFFAAISILSVIFIWTQPGFHARPLSLDLHVPSFLEIAKWYVRALEDFGFLILMENHPYLAHLVVFLPPVFFIVIVTGLCVWYKNSIQMDSSPRIILLLSNAIWTLTLIAGFLFCTVPLLFSGYYPDYVKVYPTLLMAGALGLVISFLIHLFEPDTIRELSVFFGKPISNKYFVGHKTYWFWFKWLGIGVLLLGIFSFITISHFNGIYRDYQIELISSAIRQDFHDVIEVAYYKTGQKNYIIAGCPKEILVEQFWGISGYFYWKGIDDIFGVLDTDPNIGGVSPQEVWPEKESWYKIECLHLTNEQLNYLEP